MNSSRTILKATSASAVAALLTLAGCSVGTPNNHSAATEQNAAAIATDAARIAANEMHNQMGAQPPEQGMTRNEMMMNESRGMGMGMPPRPGMKQDNMPGMGGNSMSNQAMPMEREDHM